MCLAPSAVLMSHNPHHHPSYSQPIGRPPQPQPPSHPPLLSHSIAHPSPLHPNNPHHHQQSQHSSPPPPNHSPQPPPQQQPPQQSPQQQQSPSAPPSSTQPLQQHPPLNSPQSQQQPHTPTTQQPPQEQPPQKDQQQQQQQQQQHSGPLVPPLSSPHQQPNAHQSPPPPQHSQQPPPPPQHVQDSANQQHHPQQPNQPVTTQSLWQVPSMSMPTSTHVPHDAQNYPAPNPLQPHHPSQRHPIFQPNQYPPRTNALDGMPPPNLPMPQQQTNDFASGVVSNEPPRPNVLGDANTMISLGVRPNDDEEEDRPTDRRVGKDRVQRPCHACGHLNHIRKNNCDRCDAPKQAAKKRPPRRKKKNQRRGGVFNNPNILNHLTHTFAASAHHTPNSYGQSPNQHMPHHNQQSYMPPITPSQQPIHDVGGLPSQAMPNSLQEPGRPDNNRYHIPEFPSMGFETGGFSMMPQVNSQSFGQAPLGPGGNQNNSTNDAGVNTGIVNNVSPGGPGMGGGVSANAQTVGGGTTNSTSTGTTGNATALGSNVSPTDQGTSGSIGSIGTSTQAGDVHGGASHQRLMSGPNSGHSILQSGGIGGSRLQRSPLHGLSSPSVPGGGAPPDQSQRISHSQQSSVGTDHNRGGIGQVGQATVSNSGGGIGAVTTMSESVGQLGNSTTDGGVMDRGDQGRHR